MNTMLSTMFSLQEGLSFQKVLHNIPSDPASVFVYLLLAGSIFLIVLGSRKKGKPSA